MQTATKEFTENAKTSPQHFNLDRVCKQLLEVFTTERGANELKIAYYLEPDYEHHME